MRFPFLSLLASLALCALAPAQTPSPTTSAGSNAGSSNAGSKISAEKQEILWQKMVTAIERVDRNLSGVMAVGVLDLTSGRQYLLHGDEILPQASSIKIAVLAELYHQEQQGQQGTSGKQRLNDLYTVRGEDLVPDSDIMLGLTPGITRLTNRDLATMMVAVSDNSATNALIERLGMENVNATLRSLGLHDTLLRRKMMDIKAAQQGRENVSTPREMMTLLAEIYRHKLFDKALTDDFFKVLSFGSSSGNAKDSKFVPVIPEGVVIADKPGELEAVRTDSGIIFTSNRPFVLSVMTAYLRDEHEGDKAIGEVARAAFEYFDVIGRASDYGRVISPRSSR